MVQRYMENDQILVICSNQIFSHQRITAVYDRHSLQELILLIWFNFNPSKDK